MRNKNVRGTFFGLDGLEHHLHCRHARTKHIIIIYLRMVPVPVSVPAIQTRSTAACCCYYYGTYLLLFIIITITVDARSARAI